MTSISRRDGFAMASAMALALGGPAEAATLGKLDLDDPKERAKLRAKVIGSCVEETVYTFYRLHLYGYMNAGNLIPFTTMNNLNVTKWKPLPNGNYAGTVYESGTYCKFDTDEPLDVWENPVTGEKREVWQFLGGPIKTELGPDGSITDETATVKPKTMRMEAFGGLLFVASGSAFSFPSPFKADTWPKEASGPIHFWDSHAHHAARVVDVLDPKIARAPAFSSFQNLVSFHPWLGLGGKPGRSYGKAYGAKLASLDEIPKAARATLEKKTPEIFDLSLDIWKKPIIDFAEYMAKRKPT
jgi:hypothetical protein